MSTILELETTLQEHAEQLKQVEELLLLDPDNAELADMYNGVAEVISMTEELLQELKQQQWQQQSNQHQPQQQHYATGSAVDDSSLAAAQQPQAAPYESTGFREAPLAQINTAPILSLPSQLPASVAEQIRRAQVKAALSGQAPPAWAIGAKVEAPYSADGQFYNAVIEAVSLNGNFIVAFDGYPDKEEVAIAAVRMPSETKEVYRGVSAPKRKRVDDTVVVTEIPKWLEVKDTDDEKTKLRKRKLLKSYKSKARFQEMDKKQKDSQDSWQNFQKGKGAKKKTGFLTGTKKESMFKSPESLQGKVGVVGSGKGMTEFTKKSRHEHEADDD